MDAIGRAVAAAEAPRAIPQLVRGVLPLSSGRMAYLELPPDTTDEEILDIVLLITSQVRMGVVANRPTPNPSRVWVPGG